MNSIEKFRYDWNKQYYEIKANNWKWLKSRIFGKNDQLFSR